MNKSREERKPADQNSASPHCYAVPSDDRVMRYALECLNGGAMDWDDLAIMIHDDFVKCGERLGARQWERCLLKMIAAETVEEIEHPQWVGFTQVRAIAKTTTQRQIQPTLFSA